MTLLNRFLLVFLAALVSLPVWANAETPDALIKRVSDEVLEVVRKDPALANGDVKKVVALVDEKVLPHFNFQRMTSLAVGRDWRVASPAQKTRLAEEFKLLLVRTYANALKEYSNQRLVIRPTRMRPEDAEVLVRSEVIRPGQQPVQIDYWLEKTDKGWKVFDVVVAGISLVTNYRQQFAREVRDGGIDGLISSLAEKNRSLEVLTASKTGAK